MQICKDAIVDNFINSSNLWYKASKNKYSFVKQTEAKDLSINNRSFPRKKMAHRASLLYLNF